MTKRKNKIKIFIDPIGNTFHIWWDDPKKSVESWEADESWDVLCLDINKRVIGFEKLGFFPKEVDPLKHIKDPIKAYEKFTFIEGETEGLLPPGVTDSRVSEK
jgi:hypothetical protein